MVVKITQQRGLRTEASGGATPTEPLDAFQKRMTEVVERFRSAPVTPQRFLELENALHAAAAEVCRQVVEREANRLEADASTRRRRHPSRRVSVRSWCGRFTT